MPFVATYTTLEGQQRTVTLDYQKSTDERRLRTVLANRVGTTVAESANFKWVEPNAFDNTPLDNSRLEQLCGVIDLINTAAARALSKFLRKLAVLQRLAAILEISGDLIPLPDISGLIPTIAIDLDAYRRLRSACPMLNLPAVESLDELTGLADLQRQVLGAYAELDSFLNDHPWNRAGWLQEKAAELLDKIVGPIVEATVPFFQLLECFQAVCNAAASLSVVPEESMEKVKAYWKRLEDAPDQAWGAITGAITDSMQEKYDRVTEIRKELRVLAPELDPTDFSNAGLGLDASGNPVNYSKLANE